MSAPGTSLDAISKIDRWFLLSFILSFAGHVVVLAAQAVVWSWGAHPNAWRPLKLVYERETQQEASEWAQEELRRAESRLKELPAPSSQRSLEAVGEGPSVDALRNAIAKEASDAFTQIRVGEGSGQSLPSLSFAGSGSWASAVDLTNLAEAAGGNPVLLSYFSAIREQIQQTANDRAWLIRGASSEGVVYVGFVIARTGGIQSTTVLSDRSAESPTLRDVALRIVKSAGPFPPFPPSFQESSKTIMVPLEFVLGSP